MEGPGKDPGGLWRCGLAFSILLYIICHFLLLLFSSELPRSCNFFERDFHSTDDNAFLKFSSVLFFLMKISYNSITWDWFYAQRRAGCIVSVVKFALVCLSADALAMAFY